MYLSSLTIRGLSDLPSFAAEGLGRMVVIDGPSPAAAAVGDGLNLLFAALNEDALSALLRRWGLIRTGEDAEIAADPLPTQATWSDRFVASTIVSDAVNRRIQVTADIRLDPLLNADLRTAAAGEPRLGLGLGSDASVRIEVSAFFAQSWDVLSLSVQSVVIGGERFPCASKERSTWMTRLLKELGRRFINHDQSEHHANEVFSAMVSPVAERHHGFLRFTNLVGDVRPASLPDGSTILLAGDRPLNRHGPAQTRAMHAAASATLHNADIMWLGESDPWNEALTESDDAPLEQLWSVAPDGSISADSGPKDRGVLAFGATEE